MLFDLDGFKTYNDPCGPLAGDALLTRLGRALEHAVAAHGRAYRLGGDEFCVLADAQAAAEVELAAAEALDQARLTAELHDVGKVAIPDAIINKPGPLDDAEWAFMKRHTLIGERIVAAAPALCGVAKLVRASHERWDGGGYPDGLAGEDIPLGARIVAVCDTYDAIIADRPYRPARRAAEALAELRRCAGTQFDPAVVDAFVAVLAGARR